MTIAYGNNIAGGTYGAFPVTSVNLGTWADADVGDLVLVRVGFDALSASSPVVTMPDVSGNSFTRVAQSWTATTGMGEAIFASKITTQIITGTNIVVDFSADAVNFKASVYTYTGAGPLPISASTAHGLSATPSVTNADALSGDLVVVAMAFETGLDIVDVDYDTTDGSWVQVDYNSNLSASPDGSTMMIGHKITTGAGAQTYNLTLTESALWTADMLVFPPDSSGPSVRVAPLAVAPTVPGPYAHNDSEAHPATVALTATVVLAVPTHVQLRFAAANPDSFWPMGEGTADSPNATQFHNVGPDANPLMISGTANSDYYLADYQVLADEWFTYWDGGGGYALASPSPIHGSTFTMMLIWEGEGGKLFSHVGSFEEVVVTQVGSNLEVRSTDNTGTLDISADIAVSTWGDYVIAVVADTSVYRVFSNGVQVATGSRTGSSKAYDGGALTVADAALYGYVGYVSVWRSALPTSDILSLMAETGLAPDIAAPPVVARVVVAPAPIASGAGGGGGAAAPAAIARVVVTPAATASFIPADGTAIPAVIARMVVVPGPTATGAITRTVVVPAPTVHASIVVRPAAITRTVVVPAPAAAGSYPAVMAAAWGTIDAQMAPTTRARVSAVMGAVW